tara:strand:- start:1103 stop:1225 length:123 start_codon:yes stop_codon:yes gene_type:complete
MTDEKEWEGNISIERTLRVLPVLKIRLETEEYIYEEYDEP